MSYVKLLRLIFVMFMLYLLGDVFYRWDGFKYYGTYSDFLPSVALVTLLWSTVSFIVAAIIFFPLNTGEWVLRKLGIGIRTPHMLVFLGFSALLPVLIIVHKTMDLHFVDINIIRRSFNLNKMVWLGGITLPAAFLTWLLRSNVQKWMDTLQEKISPLVWLFGIIFILSLPIVAYYTWTKDADTKRVEYVSQSGTLNSGKPNIILVIFDALNTEDMSVYGYEKPTTPFIDKWAKKATVFARAEAESNYTAPTTASLMTGKRVWTHRRFQSHGLSPDKSNTENVARLLKNEGYYNLSFSVNSLGSVNVLNVSDSFDVAPLPFEFATPASLYGWIDRQLFKMFGDRIVMHDWILKGDFALHAVVGMISRNVTKTTKPPEIAFGRFLSIVDNHKIPEPYFAWIHVLPPHFPYLPPEPYMGIFDKSEKLRTYKSQANHLREYEDKHYYSENMQPAVDILRARYDEFIRYCDHQFEDFMKALEERGITDNTVVILTSDHGESFEHGYIRHGGPHLYEELTGIPFIVREPGQTEGQYIYDPVEQIDIPATILGLADIPVPHWMEGRSLVPFLRGEKLPLRPGLSMTLERNPTRGEPLTKGTIAVWYEDYKLIHNMQENNWLLFNLKEDPDEVINLFHKEQETGQRLLGIIQDNLRDINKQRMEEK